MQCGTNCCDNEGRAFLTAEEKIEKLQTYRDWLTKEAEGVEEAIGRLKKAK